MVVKKTNVRKSSTKKSAGYRVKIITTTISQSMPKEAAANVARAAKAEIAQRGVRGAKVTIVQG